MSLCAGFTVNKNAGDDTILTAVTGYDRLLVNAKCYVV